MMKTKCLWCITCQKKTQRHVLMQPCFLKLRDFSDGMATNTRWKKTNFRLGVSNSGGNSAIPHNSCDAVVRWEANRAADAGLSANSPLTQRQWSIEKWDYNQQISGSTGKICLHDGACDNDLFPKQVKLIIQTTTTQKEHKTIRSIKHKSRN